MKKLLPLIAALIPCFAIADPVQFTGFESSDFEDVQSNSGQSVVDCTTVTPTWPVRTGICSARVQTTTIQTGNIRIGGVSQFGGSYSATLNEDDLCTTFHFRVNVAPASGSEEIAVILGDDGTTVKGHVRINSSRNLLLYDSTGTLLGTRTATIALDTWTRLSVVTCTGTSCNADVLVDGSTDITASGNFTTLQHGSVRLGKVNDLNSNAVTYYFDDIILDNASCQGNIRVKKIPVDDNGDLSQWTDGTGVDQWPQVADFPPLMELDTTFIRNPAGGFPEYSTFEVTSDPGDAPTGAIRSVKVHAYVRRDTTNPGPSQFGLIIRNNEFEYASGTNDLNDSSGVIEGRGLLRNIDPFTGAAWQPDGVQSMQIGVFENGNVQDRAYNIMGMVAYDETSVVATPTPAPTYIPAPKPTNFIPVYPGAEGFGLEATVGSGRNVGAGTPTPAPLAYGTVTVYKVTNLNDSGSGSLRDCINASGPRTCIFEVAGHIDSLSDYNITNPYITIAGQTAPHPGIHVWNVRMMIKTHDVLLQNFSLRPSDGLPGSRLPERDALVIDSSSGNPIFNVHVDRMTLAYGLDENLSSYGGGQYTGAPIDTVTISNCMIADSLNNSVRGTYYRGCNATVCAANPTYCTEFCVTPPCGQCTDYKTPHGKAMIFDAVTRLSIHDNLIAMNEDRHPRIKPGTQMEFFNNYVYGWAGASAWQGMNCSGSAGGAACLLSLGGNYYRRALYSQIMPILYYDTTIPVLSRAFLSRNVCPTRPIDISSEWLCSAWPESMRIVVPPSITSPLSEVLETGIAIKAPTDTVTSTLTNAGARAWNRWIGDSQVVEQVVANTGYIKDCISGCPAAVFPGGRPTISATPRGLTPPPIPGFIENNGRSAIENFVFSFNSDGNQAYTPQPTPTPVLQTPTPTPTATVTPTPTVTRTPTPICN